MFYDSYELNIEDGRYKTYQVKRRFSQPDTEIADVVFDKDPMVL